MTDSVFQNMKEKAYFLKPGCYKSRDSLRSLGYKSLQTGCSSVGQKQHWLHNQQTELEF